MQHIKKHLQKVSKENLNLVIGIIIIVAVVAAIIFFVPAKKNSTNLLNNKDKASVTSFINDTLLGGQATAKIEEVTDVGNVYKLKISINGQPIESYMSKDGKYFFPEAFNMASSSKKEVTKNPASAGVIKNEKPKVELFVMSYCPYGTQIEKGILPVVQALGDKIDFSLKFVDYAMHGQKEMTENLVQYCIGAEQNDKLNLYLGCFLKDGDSVGCLKTTAVNQKKLNLCVQNADKEFNVTSQFTNKTNWKGNFPPFDVNKSDNTKYGVQGSPSLVINGVQVSVNRDSASLLTSICGAFNTQPEICSSAKLSSASPTPGFGYGTTASTQAPSANCAGN